MFAIVVDEQARTWPALLTSCSKREITTLAVIYSVYEYPALNNLFRFVGLPFWLTDLILKEVVDLENTKRLLKVSNDLQIFKWPFMQVKWM
jgi:hypothetical protein